jgi:cellulose biosynthesis protein BcsQ
VLVAKEELVLQGTTDGLTEIGRCYGKKQMWWEKKKGNENLKGNIPGTDYDQNREIVEYLNYLASMITNDAKCKHKIKSRIAIAKAAFNKKKTLHEETEQEFMEETSNLIHLKHSFVWHRDFDALESRS